MALNEIFRSGDHLNVPVVAGVLSGDVVVLGTTTTAISGVAQITRDADGTSTLWFNGVWELVVGDATYAVGDAIYAHASGGTAPVTGERAPVINGTSTTGVWIGNAIEAKTTTGGTGTLRVRLRG